MPFSTCSTPGCTEQIFNTRRSGVRLRKRCAPHQLLQDRENVRNHNAKKNATANAV